MEQDRFDRVVYQLRDEEFGLIEYELAIKLGRILVTRNVKHFAPLARTHEGPGVIGIPPHWPLPRVDSQLTAALEESGPHVFEDRLVKLMD